MRLEILEYLAFEDDGCSARQVADELGLDLAAASVVLLRSCRAGLVRRFRRHGAYRYWLTTRGEGWLDRHLHTNRPC